MRYWAYFAGKVIAAAAPLWGVLWLVQFLFPAPRHSRDDLADLGHMMPSLLHLLAVLFWFLLCAGALAVIVWDQRRRCRVCLRRLRMPIETGSRGLTLQLGRPTVESICPYGHGTLSLDDADIAGMPTSQWKAHSDDIWDELCAPGKDSGQEP